MCCCAARGAEEPVRLRAWGVPNEFKMGTVDSTDRAVIDAFRRAHPQILPTRSDGIAVSAGGEPTNIVPLMQIAGDIAPDVLYVNFKMSQTYIGLKLLYPLDGYVEELAGVPLADSSSLPNEVYLAKLKAGKNWGAIADRVLPQCWPVMRRLCPHGLDCPYRREAELAALEHHWHTWSYPVGPLVMGLMYDKTMFAEHAAEGVQQRVPRDWDEMMRWAKLMTDPPRGEYGVGLELKLPAWHFVTILYSAGGRVVQQDANGNWRCVLDSEAAIDALYFYTRLRWERVVRDGVEYRGVVREKGASETYIRTAMEFEYIDDRFLAAAQSQTKSVGPVPAGPHGTRGSEFNTKMCGIFSGLKDDRSKRDAAWKYIEFYDGPVARRVRVERLVEAGLGQFVRKRLLERFNENGFYDSVIRQVSPELEETYRVAFEHGVPEPYGKNCQYVYDQMNRPIGAALSNPVVLAAIDAGQPELARPALREILRRSKEEIDRTLLGNLPAPVRRRNETVAWVVVGMVTVGFTWVLRRVFRAFTPVGDRGRGGWQLRKYAFAYLMMIPAIGSILLWLYWPMLRGTTIAFQDYSVLGESRWVGAANFSRVLFAPEFWHSLSISLLYAVLYLAFGFWVPIALAFLLQEVPRGKVLFRTIYYLPALLSGVVVIFLWKEFYAPDGLLNQVHNGVVGALNHLPGVRLEMTHQNWLENPRWALFLTLLPTIWAGMGPGCLIYLAALKTVPDELYEAAEIDGAGLGRKVFSVAVPSIRALVTINFIGAMIGAVRGASSFVLAMTGGGPYTESGGATEVVGLRLFFTTFGNLQFGVGAAMAWILGFLLIGFTVLQLQRLSRYEFRTATAGGR